MPILRRTFLEERGKEGRALGGYLHATRMVDTKLRRSRIVYRHMDPQEVLIEVIGDIEDAKVRLSLAEAKMVRSGLTDRPGHEEIVRFIGSAQRYAEVATKAALRSRGLE